MLRYICTKQSLYTPFERWLERAGVRCCLQQSRRSASGTTQSRIATMDMDVRVSSAVFFFFGEEEVLSPKEQTGQTSKPGTSLFLRLGLGLGPSQTWRGQRPRRAPAPTRRFTKTVHEDSKGKPAMPFPHVPRRQRRNAAAAAAATELHCNCALALPC